MSAKSLEQREREHDAWHQQMDETLRRIRASIDETHRIYDEIEAGEAAAAAYYAPPAPSRRRLVLPRPANGIAPVVSIAEYQHR